MIKHVELFDADSCLNKAATDEPVFVLRAKDPIAPMAIRHWATMAVQTHDPEKIARALNAADQMDEWRLTNIPGRPGGPIAAQSYPAPASDGRKEPGRLRRD